MRSGVTALAVVVALTAAGLALAQQETPKKARTAPERASGVIVKAERITPPAEASSRANRAQHATYRLTINTAAVWRDWSRDQAQAKDTGPPGKDAAKGANSVATKGEPLEANALVVIDVGPETKVETRFRSPSDETGTGKKSPEAVRKGDDRSHSAKPVHFRAEDLKPGLWVEADFRHAREQNHATTLVVIRPIGGPDTPPDAGATPRSK
jgi:hypothetical protein